jgi:hypothetical protein
MYDVRQYSLAEVHRGIGGTHCPHLQGRRVTQVRNSKKQALFATCFLLSFFFNLEYGGSVFLRNLCPSR